jgi:putative ABC transport system ATP-binding protein
LANRHDHKIVNLRSRNGPVLDGDGQAMTMRSPQVAASAVDASKVYGTGVTAVRALDAVTIDIGAAHMVAIMGPSGSGKSTLLHCMAGLDTLTGGRVTVGERDLASLSDRELTVLRRERIGFVFQDFNLIPTLSAFEQLMAVRRPGG